MTTTAKIAEAKGRLVGRSLEWWETDTALNTADGEDG